jgi:hypothetical protein
MRPGRKEFKMSEEIKDVSFLGSQTADQEDKAEKHKPHPKPVMREPVGLRILERVENAVREQEKNETEAAAGTLHSDYGA